MTDARSNWQEVLRQVPGLENVTPPSGDDRISLTRAQALPAWSSPAQRLTALRASAAGRSEKKIANVLQSDLDRRISIVRKDANKPKKIAVVTVIILLTVTVGVLFLPNSVTDFDDYFLEIGVPTVIIGLLGVASLVASVLIEKRSSPRSLPYSPPLFIVYGVLFALGTVMISMHISNYGYWVVPGATIGVVCAAVTAVGYIALFFWTRKRQTMVQALHGDTPQGREFDAALSEHIAKILRKRDDLDEVDLRRRTTDGVRRLCESGHISTDAAVSMMREIARSLN
ncbi:hypothetical protein [Paramicrobacterium agarici]|uniref:Uncharacterized protein n=1 Tax=Paramicrobacterium agarici TaxID=630514 RepID=A0A2A9DWS0_9MICO|nr:hypothetical protein [Microbacterium agarici]PFG30349.1 hypothetical protein ATJ78_1278 [Microbacterium agarici]